MSNTKISKVKVNDHIYDIDLPSDATPSIASLTTSGAVSVGGNLSVAGSANLTDVYINGNKLSSTYVKYTTSTQEVAGTSKSVSKTSPTTLYAEGGLIMGGTAKAAGLVTRGICGVTTPDSNGACSKDCLYLNCDGNDDYSRKVVLGAGSLGNAMTGGAYTYCAVRGDQMASYVASVMPEDTEAIPEATLAAILA